MYEKIMVPVDLSHRDHLDKALATAASPFAKSLRADRLRVRDDEHAERGRPFSFGVRAEAGGVSRRREAAEHGICGQLEGLHEPRIPRSTSTRRSPAPWRRAGADLVVMASTCPGCSSGMVVPRGAARHPRRHVRLHRPLTARGRPRQQETPRRQARRAPQTRNSPMTTGTDAELVPPPGRGRQPDRDGLHHPVRTTSRRRSAPRPRHPQSRLRHLRHRRHPVQPSSRSSSARRRVMCLRRCATG